MSLKRKLTLLMVLVFSLYLLGAHLIEKLVVFPSFLALERDEAVKDLQRSTEAILREIDHLSMFAHDWSSWDDTYQFVQDHNQKYITANLTADIQYYKNMNIPLIYFCDTSGFVVWGQVLDLRTLEPMPLEKFPADRFPPDHPLLRHRSADSVINCIVLTEHEPLLVASRPILTTKSEGPIAGTLIVGRFLDKAALVALREQTRVDFMAWPITESAIPANARRASKYLTAEEPIFVDDRGRERLSLYTTLPGSEGKPAVLVAAYVPRSISFRGRVAMWFALAALFIVGASTSIVLWLILQQMIIGPILQLARHSTEVAATDFLGQHISMDRDDEIGVLAHELNRMLDCLDDSRRRLLEQSYRSGSSEMASGLLHNIRNALMPVVGLLAGLRDEFTTVPVGNIEQALREVETPQTPRDRRIALRQYVRLACERLLDVMKNADGRLATMSRQLTHIEEVLAHQEGSSHAARAIESVRLEPILRDAVERLPDDLLAVTSVEIQGDMSCLPPVRVERVVLAQVVSNLLVNAAEAIARSDRRPGCIELLAELEEETQGKVMHFQVRDNGVGIDADTMEHMFDRGFSSKQSAGSGIGLHWCANVMMAMGGSLRARSDGHGHGATLHLTLPVAD